MTGPHDLDSRPLVTLLIATYNRPHLLGGALRSAAAQTYPHLEILVCRDGGQEVREVVESVEHPGIRLLDRAENRGLPYTFNRGIEQARGKYIAYLGDDDIHYPDHIESLVTALEEHDDPQRGVAYAALLRSLFITDAEGNRHVVSKDLRSDCRFNRLVMMSFNHVLGGAMMHRRDLIDHVGLFDESLKIMIDWDLNRRLAMVSDFLYVPKVTGEYYAGATPEGSDRISDKGRQDATFGRNCLRIRSHRPPKPWPKMRDASIIVLSGPGADLEAAVRDIAHRTFWPHVIYLPIPARKAKGLRFASPNVVVVDTPAQASPTRQFDAALHRCEGDFVAVVDAGAELESRWLEDPASLLDSSDEPKLAYRIDICRPGVWTGLARRDELQAARHDHARQSLEDSLLAGGFTVRDVPPDQRTFAEGDSLVEAFDHLNAQRIDRAIDIFSHLREQDDTRSWLKRFHALALYHQGQCDDDALAELAEANRQLPTVNGLWLESRLHRRQGRTEQARDLLHRAYDILQRGQPQWAN
jgi:hypothetical protein